jgi:undecaprenyl-diphosphatase
MDWIKDEDYAIFRLINVQLHSPILDPISTALSYSGLGASLVLFSLFLAIFKGTRFLTIPILAELLLSGTILADLILKPGVPRDRPSNLSFAIAEEPHRISSFPSGHTSVCFGTAFVILFLSWNSPNRKWGWVALVWAALVGLSRIYRGVHWPTDVLAGICNGLFSACVVVLITNALTKKPEEPSRHRSRRRRRTSSPREASS